MLENYSTLSPLVWVWITWPGCVLYLTQEEVLHGGQDAYKIHLSRITTQFFTFHVEHYCREKETLCYTYCKGWFPEKSSCSFGFCPPNYLDPPPSPQWGQLVPLFLNANVPKKFGQGPLPSLYWTKSKRTATFFGRLSLTESLELEIYWIRSLFLMIFNFQSGLSLQRGVISSRK